MHISQQVQNLANKNKLTLNGLAQFSWDHLALSGLLLLINVSVVT